MKRKTSLILSATTFALFFVVVILLETVDIQAIGPNDSSVGLGTINKFFLLEENSVMANLSNAILYLSFAVAVAFAIYSIIVWIKQKSFKKIDKSLFALAILYALTVCFYLLFEIVSVNKRPVLTDGELKNSFPSSHTLFACTIFLSAIIELCILTKNKPFKITSSIILGILAVLEIVTRILSGMHWFTDVLGAVLLSLALVFLFCGCAKGKGGVTTIANNDSQSATKAS